MVAKAALRSALLMGSSSRCGRGVDLPSIKIVKKTKIKKTRGTGIVIFVNDSLSRISKDAKPSKYEEDIQ